MTSAKIVYTLNASNWIKYVKSKTINTQIDKSLLADKMKTWCASLWHSDELRVNMSTDPYNRTHMDVWVKVYGWSQKLVSNLMESSVVWSIFFMAVSLPQVRTLNNKLQNSESLLQRLHSHQIKIFFFLRFIWWIYIFICYLLEPSLEWWLWAMMVHTFRNGFHSLIFNSRI